MTSRAGRRLLRKWQGGFCGISVVESQGIQDIQLEVGLSSQTIRFEPISAVAIYRP